MSAQKATQHASVKTPESSRGFRLSGALLVLHLASSAGFGSLQAAEPLSKPVSAFLNAHCLDCHDASTAKGEVNLEFEAANWNDPAQVRLLERVQHALAKGEMPPKKKTQPPATEVKEFLGWLEDGLLHRVPPNTTPPRRLNRTEYLNTVRGTLRYVKFDLPNSFPKDARAHGFDNVAGALVLSPPLLDAYAEAATILADQVFPPPRPPLPASKHWTISPNDMGSTNAVAPSSVMIQGARRLAFYDQSGHSETVQFSAPASGIYRIRVKASAFLPEKGQPMTLHVLTGTTRLQALPVSGTETQDFTFEVPLSEGRPVALAYGDSPNRMVDLNFPHKTLRDEMRHRLTRHPDVLSAILSLHDEIEEKDGSRRLKLRTPGKLSLSTSEVFFQDALNKALSRNDLPVSKDQEADAERFIQAAYAHFNDQPGGTLNFHVYTGAYLRTCFTHGPAIDIHGMEIEGPLAPAEDERDRLAQSVRTFLFGTRVLNPADPAWLQTALTRMLSRIFRRDVTPEETAKYVALVAKDHAAGDSWEQGLHHALRTALISPHFLYRGMPSTEGFHTFDLANRLAYMLTLRPPDDKLLAVARDGTLGDPQVLRSQALRLLQGQEINEFVASFTSQWLDLRLLSEIMPDPSLGSFTPAHAHGMVEEAKSLLNELLGENRPVRDLIDPDFTYVNPPMGRDIYKLEGLPVPDIRNRTAMTRISIPRGGKLGGILGMSGVMMATANGVDTQPVLRGKWMLENVLGDPVPPPPTAVPAITPDTRGAKTIRDLMAAHTQDASCAGCHSKLDPLGFALENYDALGRWRDTYPRHEKAANGKTVLKPGAKVDASTTLRDGTVIRDAVDLKRYVADHLHDFAGCLAEKLFLYGTGRVPSFAERRQLHNAANTVLAEQGGVRDLLLAVIQTEAFRTR